MIKTSYITCCHMLSSGILIFLKKKPSLPLRQFMFYFIFCVCIEYSYDYTANVYCINYPITTIIVTPHKSLLKSFNTIWYLFDGKLTRHYLKLWSWDHNRPYIVLSRYNHCVLVAIQSRDLALAKQWRHIWFVLCHC